MKPPPTFDDLFAVMAAASVGDASARVVIPDEPSLDDLPTRFGIALNILLEDLAALGEHRLHAMLDSVQDYAILMIDLEGRISSWNAGANRVFGWTAEEMVGQSTAVFRDDGSVQRMQAELARAQHHGRVEDEGWRLRKGGQRFWANVVVTAIEDAQQNVIGFAQVTRDLSERRRVEEAARIANHELEAFSYSVAHDLRSPLRAINGFAKLVSDTYAEKLDDEGREWLATIRDNSQRMAELIDGLLRLARTSRQEVHRRRVDLAALAREVIEGLQREEPERVVDVVLPEHLEVDADPTLARVLVEHLVGNAWKFTSETPNARIEMGARDGAFFVRDNGAGFDMAYATKLFVPFQRLHANDEFPGDGIGLATAQRIVQRHGGTMTGVGTVGQGATFTFTLAEGR